MAAMQAIGGAIMIDSRHLRRPTVQITTNRGGVELHSREATVNPRWMSPPMLRLSAGGPSKRPVAYLVGAAANYADGCCSIAAPRGAG